MAVVAGNLVENKVGNRTYVISEPDSIYEYSKEMEDLELYLTTLEDYIGEYKWVYIFFFTFIYVN